MEKYHYIVNVEAAIYREADGKWLITKRSEEEAHAPGMLSLVGGKVEEVGRIENILEKSVQREVMEEVGVEIEVEQYIENNSFTTDDGREAVNIVFLCKLISGEAKPVETAEIAEVNWLTTQEVLDHSKAPEWTKRSIDKAAKIKLNP